jgi:hypothetical protein
VLSGKCHWNLFDYEYAMQFGPEMAEIKKMEVNIKAGNLLLLITEPDVAIC